MTGINRLPAPAGLLIDRSRTRTFKFEGQLVDGCAGDTIASALAANDIWVLSRSFKYRRPRGALTMAGQDANTLVQLPGRPNVPADVEPVSDGLDVRGQNYEGSLAHDRGTWVGRLHRFLPVGFYYKAFYKPRGAWRFWAPFIRRKAGLGRVDEAAPHGYFDKAYLFSDVIVIGGGPAGMSAAITAAKAGAEVILVDENPILGGALNYARFDAAGEAGARERQRLVEGVAAQDGIEVMTGTVANGWFADNFVALMRGNRMFKVRAGEVVLATGAMEQPLVFRNNDLPRVMMGTAAQRLIRLYGIRPGRARSSRRPTTMATASLWTWPMRVFRSVPSLISGPNPIPAKWPRRPRQRGFVSRRVAPSAPRSQGAVAARSAARCCPASRDGARIAAVKPWIAISSVCPWDTRQPANCPVTTGAGWRWTRRPRPSFYVTCPRTAMRPAR